MAVLAAPLSYRRGVVAPDTPIIIDSLTSVADLAAPSQQLYHSLAIN